MIVALMGLPGTGKSTLARALAEVTGAVVLSKDDLRAAAFPPIVRDYSSEQNDLAMEMIYQAAAYIHRHFPQTVILLDGRTFTKQAQVQRAVEVAQECGSSLQWIECVCDDLTVRERFARSPSHSADRDFALYLRLKTSAEHSEIERLVIDTGSLTVEGAVARCLEYLNVRTPPREPPSTS